MNDNLWSWANILAFAVVAATILLVFFILWRNRRRDRKKHDEPRSPAQGLPVTPAVPADTEATRRFIAYLEESSRRDR